MVNLIISQKSIDYLNTEANENETEVCGVLVGKRKKDQISITHILKDVTSKNPSSTGIIRTIAGIWDELDMIARNNPGTDYIGEWHTHTFGEPIPSGTDINSSKSILHTEEYGNINWLVLVISTPLNGSSFWLITTDEIVRLEIFEII